MGTALQATGAFYTISLPSQVFSWHPASISPQHAITVESRRPPRHPRPAPSSKQTAAPAQPPRPAPAPASPAPATGGHRRPDKPALRPQTTTLWDYPSQHYGATQQGDSRYIGATPSYVIWNVISRYSAPGDTVLDPMCGSGTTLDVARDLGREGLGFDLKPYRDDIVRADARRLPVDNEAASLVFLDPPYGDHIAYSDDGRCIGKISAFDPRFYREMGRVFDEVNRVLKPGGVFALYVCDYFEKKKGFAPVGMSLFALMGQHFEAVDVVSVVRHNKSLGQGNWHLAAAEGNFFLRGFNYLFIVRKPLIDEENLPHGGRPSRRGR